VKPFAVAMEEGRGPRCGPCANPGCKAPDNASGQWTWLPPATELAGLDLREGAACRCNKRGCQAYFRGEKKRKLAEAMFQGNTNDPCLPKQYKVKKVKEIWGVRYAPLAPFGPKPASHVPCPPLPLARGRYTNLSKMNPMERGTTLHDKFLSEYIVYGDFECKAPYTFATSAYWVPLSKLIKNVTRARAMEDIEIFEGNMAELRAQEAEEISSEDEDEAAGTP
tara:strand:+ start:187 stop:855 length:669 start_codon:yes stop_codon:yes gene_type:complete